LVVVEIVSVAIEILLVVQERVISYCEVETWWQVVDVEGVVGSHGSIIEIVIGVVSCIPGGRVLLVVGGT
jgi:hypothetical protein